MDHGDATVSSAIDRPLAPASDRLRRWWALLDTRMGIVPIPLLVVLGIILTGLVAMNKIEASLTTMIPILAIGGFAAALPGKLPGLRVIGFPAIFATFLPSFLTYMHWLPAPIVKGTVDFTKQSNFLYLFIACIIVGSILGMNRQILIGGFARIFAPLAAGTIASCVVGTAIGTALGLGWKKSLFFVVAPIMAGGVGEGAIPMSGVFAGITGQPYSVVFGQVLPCVMVGSLTAIIFAGLLNLYGKRRPDLTGEGKLQRENQTDVLAAPEGEEERATGLPLEPPIIAAAGLIAISLYLVGVWVEESSTSLLKDWLGTAYNASYKISAPIVMLAMAVLLKLSRGVSGRMREGARAVAQFFSTCVTYPLLFAIGVALTDWQYLIATFTDWRIIVTIVSAVATMMTTGFFVGGYVGLYPIDASVVNACHSGQGGTGDVAILTSANRMELMPFAQIATRIGGAITVIVAGLALGLVW